MNQASADTGLLFPMQVYEIRPRNDKRGVDLISDVLPFGRLWYYGPNATGNAIDYAKSSPAAITRCCDRVYDDAGNVIATYEHKGDFKEPRSIALISLRPLPRSEDELRHLIAVARM
jgi:hypothetical protein